MIWLVGARGMLGQEVARSLDEIGLAHTDSDSECDIGDAHAIEGFADGRAIDWVVNCSAYTAVDKAERDEELAYRVNADGPANLAALCRKRAAALIHISTDYVFDGTRRVPYTEDDEVNPQGAYARTKAAGEQRVRQACDRYFIIRTSWLYGARGPNFVYTMLRLMSERDWVGVVNDQRGAPTYAAHLAALLCRIVADRRREYGTYHYADSGETTWYEFAREIQRLGISRGRIQRACEIRPLRTEEYPTPARRPSYSVLSKDKISATFGVAIPSWQAGLVEFFDRLDREGGTGA